MVRGSWLVLLVGCSSVGCNFVYGLEDTQVAPPDRDGDRRYGEDDNCPDTPNAGQEDGDADGVGDACDTCIDVADPSNSNEDGDPFGDRCDLCETVPDFQLDDDGDGVSNECDEAVPGRTLSTRLVFDAFHHVDHERWIARGAWAENGQTLGAIDAESVLALAAGRVDTPYYNIDLGVRAAAAWRAGDRFGVRLVDQGVVTMRCEIQCDPICTLVAESAGMRQVAMVKDGRPIVQLRARLTPNGGNFAFNCGIDYVASDFIFQPAANTRGSLEVVAGGAVELAYVGAWTHQP